MKTAIEILAALKSAIPEALTINHIALNTTTRCQQRCVYCFMKDNQEHRDLDRETVRALILAASETRCEAVIFMGAEPTLNRDIIDHIAYTRSVGMKVGLSTNAQRFKSRAFLDQAMEAGLSMLEISFPYPDEEIYASITGLPRTGFERLLQALTHINDLNRELKSGGAERRLNLHVNVVVSQFNYRRLPDVMDKLAELLPDTAFFTTLKSISPYSAEPDEIKEFRERFFVPLQLVREAQMDLISNWSHPFPIVTRGYPLCVSPGFEELHANLMYHIDGPDSELINENLSDQNKVGRWHEWRVSCKANEVAPECATCSLEKICLDRFMLAIDPDSPLNRPVPSNRPLKDVPRGMGFSEDAVERCLSTPAPYADSQRPWMKRAEQPSACPGPPIARSRATAAVYRKPGFAASYAQLRRLGSS